MTETVAPTPLAGASSVVTPPVFDVVHDVPETGYFTGVFALPPGSPPRLVNSLGDVAVALRRTAASAVYTFVSHAKRWPAEVRGTLDAPMTWRLASSAPPFALHPSITASSGVPPTLTDDHGSRLVASAPKLWLSSSNRQVYRVTWRLDASDVVCIGYGIIDRGMPYVRWILRPRSRTGQAGGCVTIAWKTGHTQVFLDFGTARTVSIVVPAASDLSTSEQEAVDNASPEFSSDRLGLVREWRGDFLTHPVVRGGPRTRGIVDVTGRANPNATGVDATFGVTWTAPVWNDQTPSVRNVYRLLDAAAFNYGERPCHWLDPDSGGIETLRVVPQRALTLHKGQPYGDNDANVLGVGPQIHGANGGWFTYDHEHRSVAMLAAAVALTGDLALAEIADSYLAAECYERSVMNNWPQPGRGQGLPWLAGKHLQLVSTDAHLIDAWTAHDGIRLQQYRASRRVGTDVTVGGLYQRGSPWGENAEGAYSDPYEQGTVVSALLANGHVQEAFDHGRGLIPGLWWDENGVCHGAYNQRWRGGSWPHALRVGQPLNEDLAPAGGALGLWVGAGLFDFVRAAKVLGRESDPLVAIAKQALRDMQAAIAGIGEGELLAALHRSTLSEVPTPL